MADPHVGEFTHRLEARRIEASAGVAAGSLDLGTGDDGEVLEFDIASEQTVNAPVADIRDVERICFVYANGRRFGETAPSHVLCKRHDFPRGLVHLCPTGPGGLAAPCLALGGLQPLYERAGIEALLERLRKFLRDAKTGTLSIDGWEPVPFAIGQMPCHGEVIPHVFQDWALGHVADGWALGMALNIEEPEGRFANVFPQILKPDDIVGALGHHNQAGTKQRAIPWVFLWPTDTTPVSDPIFDDWRTGGDLYEGMKTIGVNHAFDTAILAMLSQYIDFSCHRKPYGGKGLVVVLGVWRPEPIMREFFGYSENPEARRLELRAFRLSQDTGKDIVASDTRVETIVGDYPASPELFRWVAGVEALPPVALMGNGAIGSAILNRLVRSGLSDALVADHDRLRPHNLTRHVAGTLAIYQPKGEAAGRLVRDLLRDGSMKFETVDSDITAVTVDELAETVRGRLVIDATADERVRRRMDELRAVEDVTVVRAEMLDEGRLGVTFVAPPGGPDLADMVRVLLAEAADDPAVAEWLEHEEMNPLGPDPLLAGFGCTSQTIHLPLHAIEQHASVATATIMADRTKAGIAINPVDKSYRPKGSRWLPVAAFASLVPATAPGWSVRVSRTAIECITSTRAELLPAETGGYLYGAWDPTRQTITITTATALPPGSTASPTSLQLGPAGATDAERRLVHKTRGRIYLCGTWHSHPSGNATMSGRDYSTMMEHHQRDRRTLIPTLVVIAADADIQAHLKLP